MGPQPRLKLSRLRDIGWGLWDPIGILAPSAGWDDEGCEGFADEYDTYLATAARRLREGASAAQVVAYLVDIETRHMGLRERPDTRSRAEAVVAAILADDAIWTWPDEQGRFE